MHVSSNRDLQVLDAHVIHSKSTTVYAAEVVFDLADGHGSQLGGVTVRVDHLEPKVRVPFKVKLCSAPLTSAAIAAIIKPQREAPWHQH